MDVEHDTAQRVLVGEIGAFMAAVAAVDDAWLMAPSRCRSWSRADLLVHVHLGLQELLVGVHAPSGAAPDTDAASYWKRQVPTNDRGADGLDAVRFVQRVALAYRRPTGVVGHLEVTAAAARQAAGSMAPGAVRFQGHVMTTGDYLAMWALELCIHHDDLSRDGELGRPTAESLALTRATIEAIAGGPFPAGWTDDRVALVGSGRVEATAEERAGFGEAAVVLPALS